MLTFDDIAWRVWLILFFPIELPAAFSKIKGGTLSEHHWWWFCIGKKNEGRPFYEVRRGICDAFWLTFPLHMRFELSAWPYLIVPAVPFVAVIVLSTLFERGQA